MNRTTMWVAEILRLCKKNILVAGPAAVLLLVLTCDASVQAQTSQTEPTVWAHKVSWTNINNLNHTQRRDFPLGMGQTTWPGQPHRSSDQTTVDDTTACALAQAAGIDAFALDIFPSTGLGGNIAVLTERLNAAAAVRAETGKAFYVSPCLDNPIQYTPDQLAAQIQGLVTSLAQRPEWPKFNGIPIIWSYNATGASSAYWQQVFSLLNAQNIKVDIILDAGSLFDQAGTSLPVSDLNAYANLPVGLYSFGGGVSQGMISCRQYLAAHYPNSLAAQLTIGTVQPGYWRETNGGYGDPQGTKALRDNFASAASSRWVSITTWDDYGENTQVEPSLNMGTGRLDLLHSLISSWRGQSWPSKSQFYLWQPSEVYNSDPVLGAINGEALALISAGQTPARVQVDLCDSSMNVITAGTPVTFTSAGVQAVPYSFTLPQMPASRCAYLKYTVSSGDTPQHSYLSEPIAVWPSDNPWRTMTGLMWQTGTQSQQSDLSVVNTAAVPQLEEAQYPGFGGQFFPLLNSNLLTFPGSGSNQFIENLGVTQALGPHDWDVFNAVSPSQRWGFFDVKGINLDGTLCWSAPLWVEPAGGYSAVTSMWHFDEGTGTSAADATSYANSVTLQGGAGWSQPGQAGASCLSLDGKTGYVSIPQGIFPMGSFTFQAQINPILAPGATSYSHDQAIFCDVAASLVCYLRADGHLVAERTDGNGWEAAYGTTVVPANQWSQVTVTYDLQNLRLYYQNHLEAIVPCTGTRIDTTMTLGCNPSNWSSFFQGSLDEVKIQAQAVAPAGSGTVVLTPDQQVNLWHFDEATGTVANNATPYGISLSLPGGASWSLPGQSGAAALALDGVSGKVMVPQGAFPHGSFTLQMQVKPTLAAGVTSYSQEQELFADVAGGLVLMIRADGHLQVQRTDNKWETAYGTTVVPANQWSQVTATYDQQSLKVYLNGNLEASVGCTGTHVNTATALGCNPWGNGGSYFHGSLDEVLIQPTVIVPAVIAPVVPVLTPDQQVNLWHFDEGTGTVANNATANGISLSLPGGASWSLPGQSGAAALALDGVSGKVMVPQGAFPHGSFTLQMQVKPTLAAGVTSYSQEQELFADVTGGLVLMIRADGHLQVQRTDNKWETAYGTTVVPANQWSQVTATYDQQSLKVYLNGNLEASVGCTGTHVNTATALGCNPWGNGGSYFHGSLDEVLIQPTVIVPAVIAPVVPVLTPDQQVNLWHFDEGTGTVANNATANGISLSLPGGASWSLPGQSGAAALALDGVSGKVMVPQGAFPHGSFTLQMQVKPTLAAGVTSYSQEQELFADVTGGLVLMIRADGHLQVQRTDNKWETAYGTTVVPANQWSQVTATYDQQSLKVYLNGNLEASVGCTGTHVNTATALGCNPWGSGGSYFHGSLDEVLIQPTVIVPAVIAPVVPVLTPDQQVNLWHFDEATGTVANNATPYGISLSLPGGASWSLPGQSGAAALALDGVSGKVMVPQGAFPHGSFTLQMQVKPTLAAGVTSYSQEQELFADVAGGLVLMIRADGHLQVQRTDNKWETGYGTTVVPANQWSQVTATYDQQSLKVYLNGNLEASVGCTGTHVNTATALGCNPWGSGGSYFHGSLDEVLIQPTVIVPAVITPASSSAPTLKSGSSAPVLTADQQVNLWHFDEGTGTVAKNTTAQGIALNLPAGAGWSKPGQTGAACLSLDGKSGKVVISQGAFPHGTFTFQAQVKPTLAAGVTGYSQDQCLFADVAGALIVTLRADGRLQVQRTDSKGWEYGYGKTRVPANQWSLVTATYDQQSLKVYLNGNLEASVGCTGTHVNTTTALGCNPAGSGSSYFRGSLDEVLIHP